MNKNEKELTIFWILVVLLALIVGSYSGMIYDSREEQNKGYIKGFYDGSDYQRVYLEVSGRTSFHVNVTDIIERKGYDEFGRYYFISDIAKEDGLKVVNETGFYYKLSYWE